MIMEVSRIVVVLLASGVLVGSALAAPPMPGGREQADVSKSLAVQLDGLRARLSRCLATVPPTTLAYTNDAHVSTVLTRSGDWFHYQFSSYERRLSYTTRNPPHSRRLRGPVWPQSTGPCTQRLSRRRVGWSLLPQGLRRSAKCSRRA